MPRRCCLCGHKDNLNIRMHQFPSNVNIKKKWLGVCGFNDSDNVRNLFVCGQHFHPSSYRQALSRVLLKSDAVPSKFHICSNTSFELTEQSNVNSPKVLLKSDVVPLKDQDCSNISFDLNEQCDLNLPSTSRTDDQLILNDDNESTEWSDTDRPSTPKRRFAEPRYISEIRTSDVKSPRRASRVIKFIRSHSEKQEQKIIQLQNLNNALRQKLKGLKEVLSNLKKKASRSQMTGGEMVLPNDMDNYMEYHIMGTVNKVRMKRDCVPTKFDCQVDPSRWIKKNDRKSMVQSPIHENMEQTIDDSTSSSTNSCDKLETFFDNEQEENPQSGAEISSDEHFLNSLLPLFREIPLERKLHVEMKIINVLLEDEST